LVLHRERDALAVVLDLDDLDLDFLADDDDILRIRHAAAAHLRYVEKAVDAAEVDERAERRDRLHRTGELRARHDGPAGLLSTGRGRFLHESGAGDDD